MNFLLFPVSFRGRFTGAAALSWRQGRHAAAVTVTVVAAGMLLPVSVLQSSAAPEEAASAGRKPEEAAAPAKPAGSRSRAAAGEIAVTGTEENIRVTVKGREILTYVLRKPADSPCSSPSAAYFHPLTTPSGTVLTEVGPEDHPHHRGVFLAWLEVRSQAGNGNGAGDFWGWGEYAPVEGREIRAFRTDHVSATTRQGSLAQRSHWLAQQGEPLLEETLKTALSVRPEALVLDLQYSFSPVREDLVLGRHAFSGFSVRTRKDLPVTVHDPAGRVDRVAPSHLKPESNWPDRPWYALEFSLPAGAKAGVAVLNHPVNPPTLWHVVSSIGLLNPCITAPAEVVIPRAAPLPLRYQVVTFDGPVPSAFLDRLSADFVKEGAPSGR